MKKLYTLLSLQLLILFVPSAFSQAGTWTWISGSKLQGDPGVYGTQGVPSVNNYPPSNYEMVEWKDKQGNFWLYGGTYPNNSDLWKFNPLTLEWTWVKGDGQSYDIAVYGTQGVPDPANTPGEASYAACTWVDTSGAFWLFGGDNTNNSSNDLWRYNLGTNEWTWMNGNNLSIGNHGTLGIASPSTVPGSRQETASSWTDSLNNLWLFGGMGFDDNGDEDYLNDMMKYSISTNEWTWEKGSAYIDASVVYGTKGMSNATNDPGARETYNRWMDKQGNFWLMGGADDSYSFLNDVWKFDPGNKQWTWMAGPNFSGDPGTYGAQCVFNNTYNPGSRLEQRSSATDNCGRFWMIGGYDQNSGGGYNDLWLFDPQLSQWKWLSGSSITNQAGNYGTEGVPAPSNMPPSRMGANAWWGNDNKFYTLGGFNQDLLGTTLADLWVFSPDTTCVPLCNSVVVIPPTAAFQASKTILCENDCISFTNMSTNATSWLWTFAGAQPASSTDENPSFVCYSTAGNYDVKLIAYNSGGSDSLTFTNYITVSPAPPVPLLTLIGSTIYCSFDTSYSSYQWYDSTMLIPGATDSFLVINHNGNYNIQVTNHAGCKIAVGINILAVKELEAGNAMYIYPNPATDKLIVYLITFNRNEHAVISITNTLGQAISQSQITNPETEIDISSLAKGIYFLQLKSESGGEVRKFVKE